MSTKIGHFEILSELAKSPAGAVYKANDPESGQTIALKAIQLSAFGDKASELEQALLAEAESTNVLSSSNITKIFGAGVIEGQFCAAMEYVQGNSIATMLARKEGFSIWDLLDIGRQLCGGLDHASQHKLVHYSLEPAKIMCGWDGTVKILSFGVSSAGKFVQNCGDGTSSFLYYMSPEQIRGDATDARSNLFSLGAMFYEMVTERRAFDHDDVESLRQSILESTPVAPIQVNPKVHPLLSDLVMKALAKDPGQRFQNGREMLDSLEQCKESKPAGGAKKAEAPKGIMAPGAGKSAAQAKFVGASAPKPVTPRSATPKPPAASALAKPSVSAVSSGLAKPSKLAAPKAAAAAAGAGAIEAVPTSSAAFAAEASEVQEIDLSDQVVGTPAAGAMEDAGTPSASMSSAVADESQVETFEPQEDSGPKIAVDPMMAEGAGAASTGTSFSDISELPPLKEVYIAPPSPPPAPEVEATEAPVASPVTFRNAAKKDEKPKVQPREVAQKAIKEIKGVPPKLMAYAIGGAVALILAIGIGVTVYIHQNSDDDAGAPRATAPADTSAPEASQPAAAPAPAKPAEPAPVAAQPAEVPDQPDSESAQPAASAKSHGGKKKAAAAPVVIPGQLAVDTTPQGAQVQIDGASDPSWVTPFVISNIQPGQHSITTSKAGYVTDTRTVNVTSAYRANASIRLSQLMATLVVKSDPPGASIYVDSRDMGVKTPAQISVDKGQHVVLVRMSGYLDETMSQQFVVGQTFNFAPALRPLGNADSIKTVGKMSKLFGGGKSAQNGEATITIHTQPKGAQIAINQHMLDKTSPVDLTLDPGNYEVDITLSGYAPVHKVITANKGGKVVIDEALQSQ